MYVFIMCVYMFVYAFACINVYVLCIFMCIGEESWICGTCACSATVVWSFLSAGIIVLLLWGILIIELIIVCLVCGNNTAWWVVMVVVWPFPNQHSGCNIRNSGPLLLHALIWPTFYCLVVSFLCLAMVSSRCCAAIS